MFGDPLLNDKRYHKVPLGVVTEVGSSKRIFEKEYVSKGVPFYRTKEIVELSKGNHITTELFITRERYDEICAEYGAPQKGDLLISAVGTIGVIWIVDGNNDFYFKDGNLLRVAATEKFAPEYIKHLLETLIRAYKQEMSSGTAYAALTISALKEMSIYVPPLDLQNQFADFVAQVDKSKLLRYRRLWMRHSCCLTALCRNILVEIHNIENIKNIYAEGELVRNATVANFATVQNDGELQQEISMRKFGNPEFPMY
jgi:type I restriction enzyme S subunit